MSRTSLKGWQPIIKPYYEDGAVTIYHGDCREIVPALEIASVDLVIIDPPYGTAGRDGSVHRDGTATMGDRASRDTFVWATRHDAKTLFQVTTHDVHCYVFSDWRRHKDVQIAYELVGWELRSLIVWDKGSGMGEFWRSSHEFVLFLTKECPRKLEHGGCMNVIRENFVIPARRTHPTEKPIKLMRQLIKASSSEGRLILDSVMGSGTTLRAAKDLGRKAIGIEIEERYCEIAAKRCAQEVLPL